MFKSIKTGVVAVILIGTALIAQAQKSLDQGVIIYGMKYELSTEQKNAINESMLPEETKIKFNGNISYIEMNMGPAIIKVLSDGLQRNSLFLVDIPVIQKQYAAKLSKEVVAEQMGNITYDEFVKTGEKQTISGYATEKYTYKDNTGNTHELWATTDIKLPAGAVPYGMEALKGATPIKYSSFRNGVKTVATIKSIKEEKTGPFSLEVPKGYEEKTLAELQAMQGGGE
jgi:hypothetical protein